MTEAAAQPAGVSILIALHERTEGLADIIRQGVAALQAAGRVVEVVSVVEPGYDAEVELLVALRAAGMPVRILETAAAAGEAALVRAAVPYCRSDIVVTLPAYHRVELQGLAALVERVEAGADLAVARRWPRGDGRFARLRNAALHALLRLLLHADVRDVACGVRAFRRSLMADVPLIGDNARFFGVVARSLGYRVDEVALPQHPMDAHPGVRLGPGIYVRRLLDLLGLFFVMRFTQKPLRFFGLLGLPPAVVGAAIMAVLGWQRLQGQPLAGRPMLLAAVVLLVLGVQLLALGLVGEVIVFLNGPRSVTYRLRESSPLPPPTR